MFLSYVQSRDRNRRIRFPWFGIGHIHWYLTLRSWNKTNNFYGEIAYVKILQD